MNANDIDRLISEMERCLKVRQIDAFYEVKSCIPDYGKPSETQESKISELSLRAKELCRNCEWE